MKSLWSSYLFLLLFCYSIIVKSLSTDHHHRRSSSSSSTSTKIMELRHLFGRTVNIEIPDHEFPTKDEMESIDAMTGTDCQHAWYKSCSSNNKIENGDIYLHYRSWLPPAALPVSKESNHKIKGVVIFTHGICSHSGHAARINDRPLDVALLVDTFTSKGMAVYARDQYGHGLSEGTRFYIPDWKENRDDLIEFVKLVSGTVESSVPVFLMGESYGGCLSILTSRYFQDHPNEKPSNFDNSLILVAPAIIGETPGFPVEQILRYILAPLAPKWIPFFMPNPVSKDRIWSDKEVLKFYEDPRKNEMGLDAVGLPFRLGTAVNLLAALEEVQNNAIPGYNRPFCIVHGDGDVAVPMSGSKLLYNDSDTLDNDKELHTIEGMYHGLLAEPKAEEVMTLITNFVDARMKK